MAERSSYNRLNLELVTTVGNNYYYILLTFYYCEKIFDKENYKNGI